VNEKGEEENTFAKSKKVLMVAGGKIKDFNFLVKLG